VGVSYEAVKQTTFSCADAFVYSDSLNRVLLFDIISNVPEIKRGAPLLPCTGSLAQRLIAANRPFFITTPTTEVREE
jgi:hypothetical protein